MNQLIPVTIVTGFLGSGKTTLLGNLIKSRQSRRLALLINEFGEVSIDGALIRDSTDGHEQIQIHDFPYGLIAYGDDELFIPTMRAIAERRANVDHVLIETSGLALPTAIMELLQGPELAGDFILDATLAVVDTPLLLSDQFERQRPHPLTCSARIRLQADTVTQADGMPSETPASPPTLSQRERVRTGGDENKTSSSRNNNAADANSAVANSISGLFDQQLEFADVVVLNKIDALDEAALLLAETRVRQRAPNVRFLELAYNAQLDIRLALGLRLHQPTLVAHQSYTPIASMPGSDASVLASQSRLNGHAHSGMNAHTHGLATHKHFHEQDPGWLSFTLCSGAPQQIEKLKTALLAAAQQEPLLRIKGFIRSVDSASTVLVQAVRSRLVISTDAAKPAPHKSELVFIGYHASRARIAALLSELSATTWR